MVFEVWKVWKALPEIPPSMIWISLHLDMAVMTCLNSTTMSAGSWKSILQRKAAVFLFPVTDEGPWLVIFGGNG